MPNVQLTNNFIHTVCILNATCVKCLLFWPLWSHTVNGRPMINVLLRQEHTIVGTHVVHAVYSVLNYKAGFSTMYIHFVCTTWLEAPSMVALNVTVPSNFHNFLQSSLIIQSLIRSWGLNKFIFAIWNQLLSNWYWSLLQNTYTVHNNRWQKLKVLNLNCFIFHYIYVTS